MLQRTPTYVAALPERDWVANAAQAPARLRARATPSTRRKNIWLQRNVYRLSRSRPGLVRRILLARRPPPAARGLRRRRPTSRRRTTRGTSGSAPCPTATCSRRSASGAASVVTDRIETFTEHGLLLESGRELEADIIVTATGLELQAFGGFDLVVDGAPVDLHDTLAYKGLMLSDVPNFAYAIGYTNSSWTLKVDLVGDYLCRLIAHMDARGFDVCVPVNDDPAMGRRPLLDFGAGYVKRAAGDLPQQGTRGPWTVSMSYRDDLRRLRDGAIDDGVARFSKAAGRPPARRPRPSPRRRRVRHSCLPSTRTPTDAFFAAVEQRDDPALRGRPVIVGGGESRRELRGARFGVRGRWAGGTRWRSARRPSSCGRGWTAYSAAAATCFAVFRDTSPSSRTLSIDEAFLDVRGIEAIAGRPRRSPRACTVRDRDEVGLPLIVGVARTKHLAKIASAAAKPDGLLVVAERTSERAFLHPLPVERIWGVGPKTARSCTRRAADGRRARRRRRGRARRAARQPPRPAPARAREQPRHAAGAHPAPPALDRLAVGARARAAGRPPSSTRCSSRSSTASGPARRAGLACRTVVLRVRFGDYEQRATPLGVARRGTRAAPTRSCASRASCSPPVSRSCAHAG